MRENFSQNKSLRQEGVIHFRTCFRILLNEENKFQLISPREASCSLNSIDKSRLEHEARLATIDNSPELVQWKLMFLFPNSKLQLTLGIFIYLFLLFQNLTILQVHQQQEFQNQTEDNYDLDEVD